MSYEIPTRAYEFWAEWLKGSPSKQTFRDIKRMHDSLETLGFDGTRAMYRQAMKMSSEAGVKSAATMMIQIVDYIETGKEISR